MCVLTRREKRVGGAVYRNMGKLDMGMVLEEEEGDGMKWKGMEWSGAIIQNFTSF